jgi:thiamine biosynthesis protein ThiI
VSDAGLIVLRYGEVALKGGNRAFFLRKLRRNVRVGLKANGLEGTVRQAGQRIYVETAEVAAAVEALQRVFGLVSLSPARRLPVDLRVPGGGEQAMEAIQAEAVRVARRADQGPERTFRVEARRADKRFPVISPDIERRVGAAVLGSLGGQVQLSGEVDLVIGVEVRDGHALVFGQVVPGPGGLPLGTQGKVVALISGGIDSPVAAWLMMKRGVGIIPLHFQSSQVETDKALDNLGVLDRYAYGWRLKPIVLSHAETVGPWVQRLARIGEERWTCLFCKRAMLARAEALAKELGAQGIVLGDSLGQVASQTLDNLEVVSYGLSKPIYRPLIGLDKTEIMDLARAIGTYSVSTRQAHACPYVPQRPLTRGSVDKLKLLLDRLSASGDDASGDVKGAAR